MGPGRNSGPFPFVVVCLQKHAIVLGMGKQVTLTETQKQDIIARRQSGESLISICVATGLSMSNVRYALSKAKVVLDPEARKNNSGVSKGHAVHTLALELRVQGQTIEAIARATGMTKGGIKALFYRQKIVIGPVQAQANAYEAKLEKNPNAMADMRASGAYSQEANEKKREHFSKYWSGIPDNKRSKYTWADVRKACAASGFELLRDYPDSDGIRPDLEPEFKCHCGSKFKPAIYGILKGATRSCGCIKSRPEMEIREFVRTMFPAADKTRFVIAPKELDIWVEEKKLAIEYCGLHWHGEIRNHDNRRHLNKLEACQRLGIRLVTIFADEWLNRRPSVEGYLRAILGKVEDSIGARSCELDIDPRLGEIRGFMDENHIQGGRGSYPLALRRDGQLVAAMTFRKTSSKKGQAEPNTWELSRYCIKIGVSVPGGFSRLLSAFVAEHGPEQIISFSDRRWSEGKLYEVNGFKLDGWVQPSYWYTDLGSDSVRYHKFMFRKENIVKKFGPMLPGETEWQAMQRLRFDRIWDCGLCRWIWKPE